MIETAIRKRWGLSDEQKQNVIEKLSVIMSSSAASERDQIAASRVLVAIESQNLADEHKQVDVIQRGNRFLEIAEQLGLGETAEDSEQRQSASDSKRVSQTRKPKRKRTR